MGTPTEIQASTDPIVKQFINGEADGPISFKQSGDDYLKALFGDS